MERDNDNRRVTISFTYAAIPRTFKSLDVTITMTGDAKKAALIAYALFFREGKKLPNGWTIE